MPIFLSIICGFLCGRLMFSIYEDKGNDILNSNVIYLLEDKSYNDYDSMKSNTNISSYIYYEDNGKYNTVIAMTKNKDNIDKIKGAYNNEFVIEKYLLSDEDISNKIDAYDLKLSNTESNEEIKTIVSDIIGTYKGKEDIKMIKIS